MRQRPVVLAIVCSAVLLVSCGGGDDSMMAPPGINVTGTWNATVTVTGGTQAPPSPQFTATFTIVQSGSSVSGTFATQGGLSGQVSGSVSGQAFSFTVNQGPPCPGTFNGSATVNASGNQFSGSYSGSDCNGTLQVTVVASKLRGSAPRFSTQEEGDGTGLRRASP